MVLKLTKLLLWNTGLITHLEINVINQMLPLSSFHERKKSTYFDITQSKRLFHIAVFHILHRQPAIYVQWVEAEKSRQLFALRLFTVPLQSGLHSLQYLRSNCCSNISIVGVCFVTILSLHHRPLILHCEIVENLDMVLFIGNILIEQKLRIRRRLISLRKV